MLIEHLFHSFTEHSSRPHWVLDTEPVPEDMCAAETQPLPYDRDHAGVTQTGTWSPQVTVVPAVKEMPGLLGG